MSARPCHFDLKPILGPHIPLLPRLLFAISGLSEPVRDFRSRDLLYREARYGHSAA